MRNRVISEELYRGKRLQLIVSLYSRDKEISGSLSVPPPYEIEGVCIDGQEINWQPTLGQILGAEDRMKAMREYVDTTMRTKNNQPE